MKTIKTISLGLLIGLIILGAFIVALQNMPLTIIPPVSMTATNMGMLERLIVQFVRDNGQPPSSLEQLHALPRYRDELLTDGWGSRIIYKVTHDGEVELRSHGRDKDIITDDKVRNFNVSQINDEVSMQGRDKAP